jgi:hypothetical protein
MSPRPQRLAALSLLLASLPLAPAATAAEPLAAPSGTPASGAPVGVEAFASAVRDGNPTRLLSVWPRKGAARLFGRKVDFDQASATAKFDGGVFELLRWPKEGEKGANPAVTERNGKKGVREWQVSPEGKAVPSCTLRSRNGGPSELVECVDGAKG